ncbi:MAG: hypothetical protein RMZ42_27110 [Nostoc sp. DedQUE05]|uniref:hypothetical protein n=1 Tax=Nostoc sp. DedQUE05 TaxID=3075391 RepID=UPI002AD508A2|nr:hypothetical protein [Nostoc sp. DedQUE05]MDZ8095583.1 hypothetical protein [Nostoc sp. DedQUE05]
MNDNQENNERDKSKLSNMPKSIHCFNFIYLLFCVSLIAFGVKLISAPEKITTFSCERTPKHINCQLTNRDWWESSVKIYSELDLWMGVEVKAINDDGGKQYYVAPVIKDGKDYRISNSSYWQLSAQKLADKINAFLNDSQQQFLTLTQDNSNALILGGWFCILFGAFCLSLTICSYICFLKN